MSSTRNKRLVLGLVALLVGGIGVALALVGRSVHEATWRVPVVRVEATVSAAGAALARLDDGRLKVPPGQPLRFVLPADPQRYPFVNVAIGDAATVVSFDAPGERSGLRLAGDGVTWTVVVDDPAAALGTATTITLIASNRTLSNGLVAEILDGGSPTDLSDHGAAWGEVSLAWVVPDDAAPAPAPALPKAPTPR